MQQRQVSTCIFCILDTRMCKWLSSKCVCNYTYISAVEHPWSLRSIQGRKWHQNWQIQVCFTKTCSSDPNDFTWPGCLHLQISWKHWLNSFGFGIPNCSDSLLDSVVCSHDEASCMDGACSKCGDMKRVFDLFKDVSGDQTVSYYQWNTSADGRVRKELINCTVADAKEDLMSQLKPFGRHVYNIRRQFKELKHLKENLEQGDVIIHEDFFWKLSVKTSKRGYGCPLMVQWNGNTFHSCGVLQSWWWRVKSSVVCCSFWWTKPWQGKCLCFQQGHFGKSERSNSC